MWESRPSLPCFAEAPSEAFGAADALSAADVEQPALGSSYREDRLRLPLVPIFLVIFRLVIFRGRSSV